MPTPLTPPPLEVVLQGLHDSEIRCGIQIKERASNLCCERVRERYGVMLAGA
jgi:hypothetical protein